MSKPSQSWRDNENVNDHDVRNKNFIVVNGLEKFYRSKKYADCKFLVGKDKKETFEAHKLVLAIASEEFEKLVYSHTSAEPILVPDVNPYVFQMILGYIYLNDSPLDSLAFIELFEKKKENDELIIKLWYATKKFGLHNLNKELNNNIKVNLTNWVHVNAASKRLLHQGQGHDDRNVQLLISKCHKVFSVKTPEVLGANDFAKLTPAITLVELFSLEHLNIESELVLFQALVKYANERDWIPQDQYLLEKDENGTKLSLLQKYIRKALKQIRFLAMTLKEFDSIPSKSGFLTEFEVELIRNRIADVSSQCVSIAGFSKHTAKKRYELIRLKNTKNIEQHEKDKDIEKLAFSVEFSKQPLCITEPITLAGLTWRIIIYQRKVPIFRSEYTIYLKCDVPEAKDWKCYAQLDLEIELDEKRKWFENIPWYCFKRDNNYGQTKPFDFFNVGICHMELAISPRHVSYKNKMSNVSATYGEDARDYE